MRATFIPSRFFLRCPRPGWARFWLCRSRGNDLTVVALIGIILLIGIVKKNAIMMIDFALEAEREEHKPPEEAIFQACLLRFRPIMMTTMAALLGGLPLALGSGTGAELRRPLGHHDRGRFDCSASCSRFTPRRWFICGLTGWRTGLRSTRSAIRFRRNCRRISCRGSLIRMRARRAIVVSQKTRRITWLAQILRRTKNARLRMTDIKA